MSEISSITRLGRHQLIGPDGAVISEHNDSDEAYEKFRTLGAGTYTLRVSDKRIVTVGAIAAPPPPPVNQSSVWMMVPTISFVRGVPSSFSIAAYVSDPDGDALTITKNAAALPPGVTYDVANKRFVYDGLGTAAGTSGHVLTADDGRA
jgi:hypothetical protein